MLKSILAREVHDHRPNATAHESALRPGRKSDRPHLCNVCGESKTDIDLWAENDKTGEQLWLCQACGDW